ncbi:zinc ribbon domain-containing protein [Bacillus sp. FJAT-49711]|uniref:zinc ribbon domain-containing protein n=1 Tax=Bacillus sp. FJAT-49711 TaxID=2833585 RepID=UPI0032D5A39B
MAFCAACGRSIHYKATRKGYVCGNDNRRKGFLCTNQHFKETELMDFTNVRNKKPISTPH